MIIYQSLINYKVSHYSMIRHMYVVKRTCHSQMLCAAQHVFFRHKRQIWLIYPWSHSLIRLTPPPPRMDKNFTWIKDYSLTQTEHEFHPSWWWTGLVHRQTLIMWPGWKDIPTWSQAKYSTLCVVEMTIVNLMNYHHIFIDKVGEWVTSYDTAWRIWVLCQKCFEPALQSLYYVAVVGRFITSCLWIFCVLCIVKRALVACCLCSRITNSIRRFCSSC